MLPVLDHSEPSVDHPSSSSMSQSERTPLLSSSIEREIISSNRGHGHGEAFTSAQNEVDGVIIVGVRQPPHYPDTAQCGETQQPRSPRPQTRTYLTRFWILFVFSYLAWFQCLMWNTWGPLSESMGAAFPGWGSDTVAMMANWGTITFVVFVAPMCWLMNTRGLRVGVLVCGVLVGVGTMLRVLPFFTSSTTFFTVMCHVCAIMVGTAGTLVMAAPPLVAAEWFPPEERTTATAVSQVLNMMGNTGSYLEPLLVKAPSGPNPSPSEVAQITEDVKRLMYIWAGVGVALLLAIIVYFPAKPPLPPSTTSHQDRLNFKQSLKRMISNKDLLLVTVSYGLCLGVPSAWISVLDYSLIDLGLHQDEAMWVGLGMTLTAAVAALAMGRLTDLVYGHVKLTLILLMSGSAACFYWFFLLTWGSIPVTTWQVYTSLLVGGALNYATAPLFMELAVESSFPCSEVVVGGLLTGLNNLVGLIFLFLFFIPNIGYNWVTYLLLANCGLSLIPLIWVNEDYSRSALDQHFLYSTSYQAI